MSKFKVAGVLFGRAGSTGLPGKNVKHILNRPSLHYPLLAAKHSGVVDRLYVSTDSPEIERLSHPFDAIPLGRPAELASNTALLEDAIGYGFKAVLERGDEPDYFLILLCNSCNVVAKNIRTAFEMLESNPKLDSVTTVAEYNMFSPIRARAITAQGTLKNYIDMETLEKSTKVSCDRSLAEKCFFSDHGFTLTRTATLKNLATNPHPFRWMGENIGNLVQIPGGGDIDFEWQVPLVEWWLKKHGFTDEKTPY